jgi:hypothetical protein
MPKRLHQLGFFLTLTLLLLCNRQAWSQCTNASQFGTINAPTNNTTTTITTCAFAGEYSTINSCTAGSTYLFNATGGAGNYITIRQGTPAGTVLGFGFAPVTVTCTASGPLYLHYNTNASCGTDASCHNSNIQCTSCAGAPNPCSSITTLPCGTAVSATLSGTGLWSPGSCGFSTPGTEKVYSFTPTTTGVHSLQVNTTNSGGFIDYFYKDASGGCSSTGWTCIDDIFGPLTATIGTLTAGVTYYILLDPETTASVTQNFQIVCPSAPFDPCASIPTMTCATPVTASTTGLGVWSPGNCGFSTPGKEQVYSFTPTVTGMHTQVVTSTNGLFADYFYKAASGGCSATGWTCIGDASGAESNSFGPLTAGTTYYILYDPETSGTITQTFRIDCPPAGTPPSCIAAPTSPANGSNAGCPNTTQTLTWPSAATATSYDVYFGTSATPPFVANTASTSFTTASLPAGTYFWQIRPANSFGTASGCTVWSFTKSDVTPPGISCPANISTPNSPSTACSALVTYNNPVSFDLCGLASVGIIGGQASGTIFPVGVTTNIWRATDLNGNSTTCSFTVTVTDATLPSISCPANITTNSNVPGTCNAIVSYTTPTGSDNCGISSITQTSGVPSGGTFPSGTTTNVWSATDVNANTATCSFTVTVNDATPPTISCPPTISTTNNPATACSAVVTYPTPTGADNCGLSSIQLASGLVSGSAFPVGTTTNVWRATDLNLNTATCSFTVTVSDITLPTITCPANITANNSPSTLCSAVVTYAAPSATDNCGISANVSIGGLASGATYPVGVTTNTWRATDLNGNTRTCSFTVTVTDVTPPAATCPANILTNNSPATACSAVVTYTTPTASDNCGVSTVVLQSGLVSGATFPVGVTTNVWRATDINANTGTCSFTVTVKDVTLPSITCPANIVRNNDATKCSAVVTYTTPTATDNCSISTVTLQSGLASGSVFPVGTTTNIWRATDVNTNTSTCSFTVKVNDVEPPTINCPANVVKGSDPGQCSANLGIYIGTTTFQDNCGVSTVTNNSTGIFQVGTTTVVWKATDFSNNTGTCAQSVTIEDQEWPAVKCPTNFNVKTDEGDCVATLSYAVTATDNCPGLSLDYSTPSPGSFDIGYTNVQVTATDASGHTSTCEFQILVNQRAEICNGLDDDCDGVTDEAEDWSALAKRFAADGVAGEEYGVSVDVQGDYAIVGSNQKTSGGQGIGSAYILFRDKNGANKWGQEVELVAPGLSPGDNFGASVAIYGDYAVVGAPLDDEQLGNEGAAYVFQRNGTQWDFVKKVVATDPKSGDNFGSSLALDGDHLLVGSSLNDASGDNSGAAYMFYRNQGGADQWGQVAKLLATTGAADDNFGASVDLDGDRAIVGANGVDGLYQNAGAAYIFGRNQFGPDAWGQIARIRANQAGENDNFGASVGISGPWALVGADRNDLKGTDAGAVFVFSQNKNGIANSWGQNQIIFDVDGQAGNHFGSDVGVDAPYAVVASRGDSPFGQGSGGGFVYLLEGSTWVPADQLTDGGGHDGDALGSVAAISGRTVILGAPLYNNGQNSDQGAVVIFGGLCNDAFSPEIESRDNLKSNAVDATVNCFPVPFSDVLNIEVKGMRASDAQLTIVNTMGQIVTELYKGAIEGDLRLQWRPTTSTEGLYFLRMTSGSKVVTKAIVQTR